MVPPEVLFAAVLHFLILPIAIIALSRVAFRVVFGVSKEDELVLSQRFTRACIAVSFVYGGASTLMKISAEHDVSSILGAAHPAAVYWLVGTIMFYTFDCLMLAWYRQWVVSMWVHHFMAIVLFSFGLISGKGHGGCVCALLAEALVPWGFLLFFLRARQDTGFFFQIVCLGGMATLILRITGKTKTNVFL
jgi:hypothetical protein